MNTIWMALSVTVMMKGERPSSRILPTMRGEGKNRRGSSLNADFLRKKKLTAHTAETPCERMVASAAPFTPIPNT